MRCLRGEVISPASRFASRTSDATAMVKPRARPVNPWPGGLPWVAWADTGRAQSRDRIRGRFPRQIHIGKVEGMVHDAVDAPSRRWRGVNRLRQA